MVPTTSTRGNRPAAPGCFRISWNSRHLGVHQSRCVTLRAFRALTCPPTGVPGLGIMVRHVQCDQSCCWAHASCDLLATPRQPRSNVARARPGATIGTLDQGGPSAGCVARSIPREAKALPSRKRMCRAVGRPSEALAGVAQGLTPLPGREAYESRLSP
jgi:hypothetical protein